MDGTRKYAGTYANGDAPEDLNRPPATPTQTITSDQAIQVLIYWGNAMTTCTNIVITFYTGLLGAGDAYIFYLDPGALGLGSC
jgi:hypothetical protein